MRLLVLTGLTAAAAIVGQPTASLAQEEAIPVNPSVIQLIADIEAGKADAAVARINLVEDMSGRPRLVTTGRQVVDRLRGCKLLSQSGRGPVEFRFERTEWACRDGTYRVSFVGEPGKPYVVVAEFLDPARLAELKANPPRPPAPPAPPILRPVSPEIRAAQEAAKARLLDQMAAAVTAGNLASASAQIRPNTRFTLGYRDIANSTTFVEMDGEGLEEGQRQVRWVVKNLGSAGPAACKRDGMTDHCTWKFGKPGRSLLMFAGVYQEKLVNVQFLYVNEKVMRLNLPALLARDGK